MPLCHRQRRRRRRSIFGEYHFRNEFITHVVEFLVAFIDGYLAHVADTVYILFGYGEVTHTCDKVDDARSNTMRRVFRNHVLFLNHHRNKLAQFRQFIIDGQATAISLDERFRFRFAEVRFLRIV